MVNPNNVLLKILLWIISLFKSLPNETKEKIIEAVTKVFEEVFRRYYRTEKKGETS